MSRYCHCLRCEDPRGRTFRRRRQEPIVDAADESRRAIDCEVDRDFADTDAFWQMVEGAPELAVSVLAAPGDSQ